MRILVFGDSIGQGFWDTQGGWVQRLSNQYSALQIQDFTKSQPTFFNLSVSGDTTRNVCERAEAEIQARIWPGEEFAFVFALGTNDSYSNSDGSFVFEIEAYQTNLERLIAIAEQFTTKSRILFVGLPSCDEARTTPLSWVDLHQTNQRLFLFEKAMQSVCERQGITCVPVCSAFQRRQESEELLQDGLHPNNAGHAFLLELIAPHVEKLVA